jgi:hypothetical protein
VKSCFQADKKQVHLGVIQVSQTVVALFAKAAVFLFVLAALFLFVFEQVVESWFAFELVVVFWIVLKAEWMWFVDSSLPMAEQFVLHLG